MRNKGITPSSEVFLTLFRGLHAAGRVEDCHYVWLTLSRTPRVRLPRAMFTELIVMFAEQGNLDDMQVGAGDGITVCCGGREGAPSFIQFLYLLVFHAHAFPATFFPHSLCVIA